MNPDRKCEALPHLRRHSRYARFILQPPFPGNRLISPRVFNQNKKASKSALWRVLIDRNYNDFRSV